MAVNADWHKAHRMPKNASLQQRIDWHVEHQKHCAVPGDAEERARGYSEAEALRGANERAG